MHRFFLIILTVTIVLLAEGCGGPPRGGGDAQTATEVTFEQLDDATRHLPVFFYIGSDDESHYFRGDGIGYYRLHRSEPIPELPSMSDGGIRIGEIEVFVIIRDGKLTVPGPDAFPIDGP